jgi:hypothetical protein
MVVFVVGITTFEYGMLAVRLSWMNHRRNMNGRVVHFLGGESSLFSSITLFLIQSLLTEFYSYLRISLQIALTQSAK